MSPVSKQEANLLERSLEPTRYVDSEHPAVVAFASDAVGSMPSEDPLVRGVKLFYAVRDGLRYDPYAFSLDPATYVASTIAKKDKGFCVTKAILLAASCRAQGIPARLGFADVRNHLASGKLRALMGTDVFAFHGYVEMSLADQWVKATPAFDRGYCEHFGVRPLEFDGHADALLNEFKPDGSRHMEYIRDHGCFFDLPFDAMMVAFERIYGVTRQDDITARG